ncbi:polysaccharide deacetylase family protein [Streptomyces sp. NPDC013457]|uniref:polysaccharide deacetylase family protein n=1 Tax=Streptomyces sp. NPDC013457 TaxID=3364866 RepID=UPI0036F62F4B
MGGCRNADGGGVRTDILPLVGRRLLRRLFAVSGALLAVVCAVPAGAAAVPAPAVHAFAGPALGAGGDLSSLFGSENRTFPTSERLVAVSFNAAWNEAGLDTILAELDRRRVLATFFLTGDFADRHPQAVSKIAAAGHGLANHSYSHPYFADLTEAGRREEVRATDRALRAAGAGQALTPFFRFPYGETSPTHIAEVNALGYADIEFTTDTNGWKGTAGGMTVDLAVHRAVEALRPGAILQMHIGATEESTENIDTLALPAILDAYTEHGYHVVDLRTLTHSDDPTVPTT